MKISYATYAENPWPYTYGLVMALVDDHSELRACCGHADYGETPRAHLFMHGQIEIRNYVVLP